MEPRLFKIREVETYKRIRVLAQKILDGQIKDPTKGATHYYRPGTETGTPHWASHGVKKQVIGSHIYMQMRSGGI